MMPIFTKDNKAILFIHIPKSAGSSVERIAREKGWKESFSVRGKSLREISYYKASPQHIHASALAQILDFNEFDQVFTIVRNPFDRLKSEYYWQLSQGITKLEVSRWILETLESYKRNPFLYDNHIRPQVEFLPEMSSLKVFRLEDGGVDNASNIFSEISSPSLLARLKKSLFFKSGSGKREKVSAKNPEIESQFSEYYDTIRSFYRRDYQRFKYT